MPDERRQFRILYRDFLFRLVDLDLLSHRAEIQNLLVQFAGLLAAFSFVYAVLNVPKYPLSTIPRDRLLVAAWGDQEFLIATTMAIAGLFTVLAWNSVFPDRRDSLVLGPLPVRLWTIFRARLAAVATALGVSILALNMFTGLSIPFVMIPPAGTALWSLAAYWITMAAAGLFVFSALLAIQGVAAQLFTYRIFMRVSAILQLTAFFVILGVYFLTPPLGGAAGLTASQNQWLLGFLPSYWFLGLYQQLNGPVHPAFAPLAARALWMLGAAFCVAGATFALAWQRNLRRVIEQPDITPADRSRPAARLTRFLVSKLVHKPLDRAILLFIARTIGRSRQHRLLLAAYGGIGLALALAYAKDLLYGHSGAAWHTPNTQLLAVSLVLLFFAVVGARAVFALPTALPSNWIFRITAVHRPASYFNAVKKALYVLAAVPVWALFAIVSLVIWPAPAAVQHMAVLLAIAVFLVERSLYKFRKIPFACSYLPGKANLRISLGAFAILFLFVADVGVRIELWAMSRSARYFVLVSLLLTALVWARRRTAALARAADNRLQFEDAPPADVFSLDLRRDGAWSSDDAYVDAIDEHFGRSRWQRVRPVLLGVAALIAAGIIYEQISETQDHRRFPRIGRSVDIGGRSLNIYCSGEGSPTVVFESGAGRSGYSWVFVQRQVSQFTRACWYDRAGHGWSDPGPFPRNSADIARDLHSLLHAAKVQPPYVLTGASFGGFIARVYNDLYSDEVAGMVLVDSAHEDEGTRIPRHRGRRIPLLLWYPSSLLAQALYRTGVIRLLMDTPEPEPPPNGFTTAEWVTARAFGPRTLAESAKTLGRISAEQARAARGLGDRPLIVLTAGLPSGQPNSPVEARQEREDQDTWIRMQQQFAALSRHGRQIVVANSSHGIQYMAPEAVIDAVREVVSKVRRDSFSAQAADNIVPAAGP